MTDFPKILAARNAVKQVAQNQEAQRSYAAAESKSGKFTPTEDHHHEAQALALAGHALAAQYGYDPENEEFHDHLDRLTQGDDAMGDGEDRSFALPMGKPINTANHTAMTRGAPRPGMTLQASKTNPNVRRWVKVQSMMHTHKTFGDRLNGAVLTGANAAVAGGKAAALTGGNPLAAAAAAGATAMATHATYHGMMHSINNTRGLKSHENAMHADHYLTKHAGYVNKTAKALGVHPHVVAKALAFHASSTHSKNMGNGKVFGKNKNYHSLLGGQNVKAFHANAVMINKNSNARAAGKK